MRVREVISDPWSVIRKRSVRGVGSVGLSLAILAASAGAATFDEQRKAVAASPATQPEAVMLALLKAGLEEGKPTLAIADVQKWLRQNLPQDGLLLYHAGRAAELSGDWKSAVSLYQQYLKKADLRSDTADEAVYAVYALLLERLGDVNGAYAFGRNEGGRLLVCPRARQFDAWFLDTAMRRADATAVALRLHACITAGMPSDLLVARYSEAFRWLLGSVDGYCEQPGAVPVTQDLYEAIKALCAALTFNDELKLRLDWAVSVKAYNLMKIGGDGAQQLGPRKLAKGMKKGPVKPLPNKAGANKKEGNNKQVKLAAEAQAANERQLEVGADAMPPIAEATALLAKYPQYALWVQTGWAGGGNGQHYRNDQKKYWPHEIEAKMAPVIAAFPKLNPLQRAELLQSWNSGYYISGPLVTEVKGVRDYLKANPKLMDGRTGVLVLDKPWNQFTPEEAQKMAPLLMQSAHPQVSLLRAIAAGGKDLDKAMAALLGPEVWRLGQNDLRGAMADSLWHYCDKPGGSQKRDAEIAKTKAFAKTMDAKEIQAGAPSAERLAAFRKLWGDYCSPQPKIPGVYPRLVKVLLFTPEVIPELLKDTSPEAQMLVREAIASGMTGPDPLWAEWETAAKVSSVSYAPGFRFLLERHGRGDFAGLKQRFPQKCKPHPLESVMRQAVADGLQQNRLEPWQVLAWINMQYPEENAEQVKLMQALFASPAWKTMPFEVQYAARDWFAKAAMTPAQSAWLDAADPALVCKALLDLPKEAEVAATAAALGKVIDGLKKSPVKIAIQGLDRLAAVTEGVFNDPQVINQLLEVADGLRDSCERETEPVAERLFKHLRQTRDPVMLQRSAAYLWTYVTSTDRGRAFEPMKAFTQSLVDEHPAVASALAGAGVEVLSRARSIYGFNPLAQLPVIKDIVVKTAMKMGLMVIPVAATEPSYPIYKSQAEWLGGNEDSAWTLCNDHWEQLLPVHRELSMDYLMWVLRRTIYSRDDARQEELVKALLAWANEANTPLSPTQKIEIEIAYGDIAVQRGLLKQAHELYTRMMQNAAYDGLPARNEAALRRVRVERMEKNFEAALQTLGELEMERVPEMWSPIRYARAEVYFDMEEYDHSASDIDSLLAREPAHAEAKIMQGKLQLKRQKLMEATEVELGTVSSQQALVPGEKLKVTLSDPTLAVSGAGTEIEVVVWAEPSGDRERFFLRQFGDQKTKFRGEVATALGTPSPDDRILQVVGDDKIYYAYSERFRQKMNNMEEKRGGPITVASDALLMASARKLLSEDEQRVADMEAQMDALRLKGNSTSSVRAGIEAQRAAVAAAEAMAGESASLAETRESEAMQKRLLAERVKPGNPIYIRVIDPDRSRTAGIDEVAVSIESSTGDAIGRVTLQETGTHTGWFEGSVPTAGAQAKAFAQRSEPGRNPNMVISPTPGYPAWRPEATPGVAPEFVVDLNDNIALGELTLTAKEPGSKLKKFVLQTGMNAREMTTVAVYPVNQLSLAQPWNPSIVVMNDTDRYHASGGRSVEDLRELTEHLERGWMSQQFAQGVATNVAGPSEAFPEAIPQTIKWRRQGRHDVSSVIYRFQGYFYEPYSVMRRFRLELGKFEIPKNTHPSINHPPQFLLAVDGRPLTTQGGKLEGEALLKPGLHRFEIWATGWVNNIGFGRTVKLLANVEAADTLASCPDRFFDPATFPKGVLSPRNASAGVTAQADNTVFHVKFAPGSRTRLLKLICVEQEGPVPALNTLALTDSAGKRVLPVPEDFAALNKNETLEILTGDKVAVRYLDDRFVTKTKEKHERLLNVAFTSAKMQFEYFEMRKKGDQGEEEYYEKLLRFVKGKPVLLTLTDADMDVSANPDKVTVTFESKTGGKRKVVATESGESTGIFRVRITPVGAAPTSDNEIQVGEGETLTAVYRDEENTDPGVPTDRYASLQHAAVTTPELVVSHATVTPLEPANRPGPRGLIEGFASIFDRPDVLADMSPMERRAWQSGRGGAVQPRWSLSNDMCFASSPPARGFEAVLGQTLYVEVMAPHLALRAGSEVQVYVQTEAGRKRAQPLPAPAAGEPPPPAFNLQVPGTLQLDAGLELVPGPGKDAWRGTPRIPIYVESMSKPSDKQLTERFVCRVPLIPGVLPEHGVLTAEEIEARAKARDPYRPNGLVVKPGDRVHVGFRYTGRDGAQQWLTTSAKISTHPVLDVMEEDYRTVKTNAYVGEILCLRVVDLGADVSDRSDSVRVLMQARSGAKCFVELNEVDTHSGVFKGAYPLSYLKNGGAGSTTNAEMDVKAEGFPVIYGDEMGARYTDAAGVKTETRMVRICKGADGAVAAFSKKYDDPEMAMRTQFTLAESYLEVAKHHRELGEAEAASHEYDRAKQMLASAMDQFRDKETRAHAEYLLGNLTLEEADTTEEKALKEDRYRAALSRFMKVTGSYPDTLHASKAQFKIATVYEKLKEPDIAAQEYVKLAYKYPDSEFLATAMARLGTHFQRTAVAYEKRAKPLLEQKEDKNAQFDGAAQQKMAVNEYLKAANIFGRLQERFPDHELAGKGGLYAGQAYLRAGANRQAVNAFLRVVNTESYDGPEIRAQAMYWAGICYENLKEAMAAYSIYKRLTFDFPESKWASYARAQLSQEGLLRLESELEIKRLEEGR